MLARCQQAVESDTVGARHAAQGDVGCGKTIVAFLAAAAAVSSNLQVAIMAPTGILAEQHFANLTRLMRQLPTKQYVLLAGLL